MIWFTSDQHFGHENIIKYCDRPFESVEEMDRVMVKRWNERVEPNDKVYHLSDFCLKTKIPAAATLGRLNGRIRILSNPWHHDRRWLPTFPQVRPFSGTYPGPARSDGIYSKSNHPLILLPPVYTLEAVDMVEHGYPLEGPPIILCHYPFHTWDRKHYGSWHLYGHTHQKDAWNFSLMDGIQRAKALNVGVDAWDFRPVSLEQVREVLE
jgi:calcineurin-like phosphoesterase family protein